MTVCMIFCVKCRRLSDVDRSLNAVSYVHSSTVEKPAAPARDEMKSMRALDIEAHAPSSTCVSKLNQRLRIWLRSSRVEASMELGIPLTYIEKVTSLIAAAEPSPSLDLLPAFSLLPAIYKSTLVKTSHLLRACLTGHSFASLNQHDTHDTTFIAQFASRGTTPPAC